MPTPGEDGAGEADLPDGTQDYSSQAVASVTQPIRARVRVLSSGNSVAEYQRLAAFTDGDAYYWSSVDLATDTNAAAKLNAMGAAVHASHGIWIPSFSPGYNSTLIGGHIIVPRAGGATLRAEYATAAASSPDILGLISWNEWTENTNVEPSASSGLPLPQRAEEPAEPGQPHQYRQPYWFCQPSWFCQPGRLTGGSVRITGAAQEGPEASAATGTW
jgi:hypothetical protein